MPSTPSHARGQLSLLSPARTCLYAGLFMVSLLVFRVAGTVTIGDVFLVVAVGLTAMDAVASGRRLPTRGVVAFAMVFVGGTLASLLSADPGASVAVLARVVFLAFLVPWAMGVLLTTRARVRRAVMWLAAGAAFCGVGAIIQASLGNVIPGSAITTGGRFSGFAAHVSDTGGITCLAVVYGAGLFLTRSRRLLGGSLFVLGLAGLILSGSVSGMIAAAVGGLALLIWHRLSVLKTLGVGIVMIGAAVWALNLMSVNKNALTPMERFEQVTSGSGSTNTTESRWDSIVAGLNGFVESAYLGVGLEPGAASTSTGFPAHNFLVAALFQGGILFTIGLVLAILVAARTGLRMGWLRGLHATVGAGMATALMFAMSAPSTYNRYFWLPLALAVVAARIPQPSAKRSSQSLAPAVTGVR